MIIFLQLPTSFLVYIICLILTQLCKANVECLQWKTVRLHSGYTITRPVLRSGVDVAGLRCLQSNPPNTNINTLLLLYLLVIHPWIFSYSVLHKTAPCLSSLTLIAARLLLSAPSLLRFSGGFCPFHAHCSPYSTVQHGWSEAAAESERTSG